MISSQLTNQVIIVGGGLRKKRTINRRLPLQRRKEENIGLPSSSHDAGALKWVVAWESSWARVAEVDWPTHEKVLGEEEGTPWLEALQMAKRVVRRG